MSKILSGEYTAITIAEDVTLLVNSIDINVFDSISVDDTFLTVGKSLLEVSLSEAISIIESQLIVNVGMNSDSISVATSVTVFIPILLISTYDSVSIADTYTRVLAQLTVHDSIYIRSVFNESIASTTLDSIPNTIVSTQTIFSSAIRTAVVGYYISNSFKVSSAIMLRFHFDVTVEAGTSSLGSIIQVSPDNVTWYDALTIPAITAIGNYTGTLANPGVYVRVKSIITGTSFTYSCLMTKHMINIPSPRMVYA